MALETARSHPTRPMPTALRPILKWAGGKRWLVPELARWWRMHGHGRLVEPFCGGLAVALGLRPQRALLNDVNPHLINFYAWVRRGLHIEIELANDSALYYRHRTRFNALIAQGRADTAEAASLFYYLNRTGYNGLCRFNRRGLFNVPFGRYARIAYRRTFPEYRAAMQGWTLACGDFAEVRLEPGDFVYADPPYDVPFRQYARGGFDWDDQVRLAHWLAAHDGPVVASNQATDRIVELYRSLSFRIHYVEGPRRISCTGDRSPAPEILAVRNVERRGAGPIAATGR